MDDEKPIPRWQKLVAVGYAILLITEAIVFRNHLRADFVPVDNSHVAPNILASILIVQVITPIGVLIWPPTRRRIHRFVDRKLGAHHDALHARHDQLEASHQELHEKFDRLLAHLERHGLADEKSIHE